MAFRSYGSWGQGFRSFVDVRAYKGNERSRVLEVQAGVLGSLEGCWVDLSGPVCRLWELHKP